MLVATSKFELISISKQQDKTHIDAGLNQDYGFHSIFWILVWFANFLDFVASLNVMIIINGAFYSSTFNGITLSLQEYKS